MVRVPTLKVRLANRNLRLAELLVARLCHDLAGGLSAVMNAFQAGIEAGPAGDPEALEIAGEAATSAVRRLRLLRAAWGGGDGPLSLDELRQLSAGLEQHRLVVDLDGIDADAQFTAGAARLVLNVMLLGAECLPRGGTLTLAGDPARELHVSIDGPGAGWTPGFPACLADPEAAWSQVADAAVGTGRGVQGALTALIMHETGLGVSVLMAGMAQAAPPLLLRLSPKPG